jgi:hypothetical protein
MGKPAELNDAIFQLMLLQETIQLEQARKMKVGAAALAVKRSARVTFFVACSGDKTYRYAVETALKAGTTVIAVFQRRRFIGVLWSTGYRKIKSWNFATA